MGYESQLPNQNILIILTTMKFVAFEFLGVAMLMLHTFAAPLSEERRRGGDVRGGRGTGGRSSELQRGGGGGNQLERQPQQMIGEFTFDKWNVNWTGGEGAGGGGNPLTR